MIGNEVYLVMYEYERSSPVFYSFGVMRMIHVYKCDFEESNEIVRQIPNSSERPFSFARYTRDQFTDAFFGGIAEEWKG